MYRNHKCYSRLLRLHFVYLYLESMGSLYLRSGIRDLQDKPKSAAWGLPSISRGRPETFIPSRGENVFPKASCLLEYFPTCGLKVSRVLRFLPTCTTNSSSSKRQGFSCTLPIADVVLLYICRGSPSKSNVLIRFIIVSAARPSALSARGLEPQGVIRARGLGELGSFRREINKEA